jgi:hypothetical protein
MKRELPSKKVLLSELDELESRLIFSPISPFGDGAVRTTTTSSKIHLKLPCKSVNVIASGPITFDNNN